jgi:hypothetical protein
MFNLLNEIPRGAAAEAMYFAGWRISERARFPDWRRWLPLRPGDPAFLESTGAAEQLLEELEARAGKPLAEMTEDEVDRIWEVARKVMKDRYDREIPPDPEVAERVLADLRREYGEGYVHALA